MARSSIYPPSVQPGKPRLPPLPAGWSSVAFGDILEVVERPAKLKDDQEYQLVTAKRSRGGIVPRERLLGLDILTKTQFYVREGDFLISNRQIIHGGCGIVPPSLDGAIVSNEYTALRPKPNLSPDYLVYLSHTVFFQQTCFHASVGVDVEKMVFDIDQWLSFKMNLPPFLEQLCIAEALSSIGEAMSRVQAVMGASRMVKNNILKNLLTNGVQRNRFRIAEIGRIPENWSSIRLKDICESMKYGTSAKCEAGPDAYPVLRIPNVSSGRISFSDMKYADLPSAEVNRLRLRDGDIITIRTNGNPNYVGSMSLVRDVMNNTLYASYLIRIRINKSICMPEYVVICSRGDVMRESLCDSVRTSAGNYNINIEGLGNAKLMLPPLCEQEEIVEYYRVMENCIENEERNLNRLGQLKSALLSDLLSGRKRVPMAEHAPVG